MRYRLRMASTSHFNRGNRRKKQLAAMKMIYEIFGSILNLNASTDEMSLPNELWAKVFSFVEEKDELRLVCRQWKEIVNGCFDLTMNINDKNWKAVIESDTQPFINTARVNIPKFEMEILDLKPGIFLDTINHLEYEIDVNDEKQKSNLFLFLSQCKNLNELTIQMGPNYKQVPVKALKSFFLRPKEDKTYEISNTLNTFRFKRYAFREDKLTLLERELFLYLFPILANCPITRIEFWDSWKYISPQHFFNPYPIPDGMFNKKFTKIPVHLLFPVTKSLETIHFGFTYSEWDATFKFKTPSNSALEVENDHSCQQRELKEIGLHLPEDLSSFFNKKVRKKWWHFIKEQKSITAVKTTREMTWKNMTTFTINTLGNVIFENCTHSLKKLTLVLEKGWKPFSEFDIRLLSSLNQLEYLEITPYKEFNLDDFTDKSNCNKVLVKNLMDLPESLKCFVLRWPITYGAERQSWNWLERLKNLQTMELCGIRHYFDYREARYRAEFADSEDESDTELYEMDFPPWYVSWDTTPEVIGSQSCMDLQILPLLKALPSTCKKLTLIGIDSDNGQAEYLFRENIHTLEKRQHKFYVYRSKTFKMDGTFGCFKEELATKIVFIKKI